MPIFRSHWPILRSWELWVKWVVWPVLLLQLPPLCFTTGVMLGRWWAVPGFHQAWYLGLSPESYILVSLNQTILLLTVFSALCFTPGGLHVSFTVERVQAGQMWWKWYTTTIVWMHLRYWQLRPPFWFVLSYIFIYFLSRIICKYIIKNMRWSNILKWTEVWWILESKAVTLLLQTFC